MKQNKYSSEKNSSSNANHSHEKPTISGKIGSLFLKVTQGLGTVINVGVKKLTRILYLYASIEGLANLKLPGVIAKVINENTLWEWYPKYCLPTEKAIYENYNVLIETPTLTEAPIVVHAEIHNKLNHYQLRDQLLSLYKDLETPPTVLIEAFSFDDEFPCQKMLTCVYPAHDKFPESYLGILLSGEPRDDKAKKALCRALDKNNHIPPLFYTFTLPKEFRCRGWDKKLYNSKEIDIYTQTFFNVLIPKLEILHNEFYAIQIKQKLSEKSTILVSKTLTYSQYAMNILKDHVKELRGFDNEMVQLESSMKELKSLINEKKPKLNKHLHKHIQLLEEINEKIKIHINNMTNLYEKMLRDDELVERNKFQIEASESIRQSGAKAIVLTGKEHVISQEEHEQLDKTGELRSPSKSPSKKQQRKPQSELRAYYKQRSAALLIPKNQQRKQKSNNHFKKSYR